MPLKLRDWVLLARQAPAIQDVISGIVRAFAARDDRKVRQAAEAALRLAFVLRQKGWPGGK